MARKRPGQHSLRLRGDIPSAAVGVSGAKNALHKAQVLADSAGVPVTKVIHQTPNGQVTAVGGLSSSLTVAADVPVGAERPGIKRSVNISVHMTGVALENRKHFERHYQGASFYARQGTMHYEKLTGATYGRLVETLRGVMLTTVLQHAPYTDEAGRIQTRGRVRQSRSRPFRGEIRRVGGITGAEHEARWYGGVEVFPEAISIELPLGALVNRGLLMTLSVEIEATQNKKPRYPLAEMISDLLERHGANALGVNNAPLYALTRRRAYEVLASSQGKDPEEAVPRRWRGYQDKGPNERARVDALLDGGVSPLECATILAPVLRAEFADGATSFELPNDALHAPEVERGAFIITMERSGAPSLPKGTSATAATLASTAHRYSYYASTEEGLRPSGVAISAEGELSSGGTLVRRNGGASMGRLHNVTPNPHFEVASTYHIPHLANSIAPYTRAEAELLAMVEHPHDDIAGHRLYASVAYGAVLLAGLIAPSYDQAEQFYAPLEVISAGEAARLFKDIDVDPATAVTPAGPDSFYIIQESLSEYPLLHEAGVDTPIDRTEIRIARFLGALENTLAAAYEAGTRLGTAGPITPKNLEFSSIAQALAAPPDSLTHISRAAQQWSAGTRFVERKYSEDSHRAVVSNYYQTSNLPSPHRMLFNVIAPLGLVFTHAPGAYVLANGISGSYTFWPALAPWESTFSGRIAQIAREHIDGPPGSHAAMQGPSFRSSPLLTSSGTRSGVFGIGIPFTDNGNAVADPFPTTGDPNDETPGVVLRVEATVTLRLVLGPIYY